MLETGLPARGRVTELPALLAEIQELLEGEGLKESCYFLALLAGA